MACSQQLSQEFIGKWEYMRVSFVDMRLLSVILLACFVTSTADGQCGIPAKAQSLATRIRQLATRRDKAVSARQSAARRVSASISEYVISMLEHTPSTTANELQSTIGALLGRTSEDDSTAPRVFASGWGPRASKRIVVLAYVLDLGCMGPGCTFVRIETLVWEREPGKAHSTSKNDEALNGRRIEFQLITQYIDRDEYWIMASGPITGWSGRTFVGRAVLYRVNSMEVRPIWGKSQSGLTVHKNELGWEANYADPDRFYSDKPNPYVFDVYALDWKNQSFHRVIHHRY